MNSTGRGTGHTGDKNLHEEDVTAVAAATTQCLLDCMVAWRGVI